MKKYLSNKAFTLIELLVSLVLVSVVLLGIFSISLVLNSSGQDFGQRYLVKSDTQTTLNHILSNASLAVGNGTIDSYGYLNKGILIGGACSGTTCGDLSNSDTTNNPNTFCIHQGGTGNGYTNITSSTADIWLCYTWYSAAAALPYQIYYCTMPYTDTAGSGSSRGAASCNSATNPNMIGAQTYLGTAFSISSPSAPSFVDNAATNQLQFSITITNCLNDSAPSPRACSSTGTSGDPVNNPEVQLSGSITPSQEGM